MIYRARFACTPDRPVIENAGLEVRDGRVISLGPARGRAGADEIDLGDVLLLPGLINAHTHLELSCLRREIPFDGCFADWVATLLRRLPVRESEDKARASIRAGIEESLGSGVTTVADIGYGARQIAELSSSPLRAICFLETLGTGSRCDAAIHDLDLAVEETKPDPPSWWAGLSPHAPYSTEGRLYGRAIARARKRGWPICTHLAETREEDEFLRKGSGPLRGLLSSRGLIGATFEAAGCGPVEWVERAGLLEAGAVLVHVNYATDRELEMIAGSDCSVVFCPRAHRFFGHAAHRFAAMMALGINVCLGTDSLASNDSLSILDEWRFLHAEHPELEFEVLLKMSTSCAARALGIEDFVEGLERGRLADFITVPVRSSSSEGAMREVLESDAGPLAVYISGKRVVAGAGR